MTQRAEQLKPCPVCSGPAASLEFYVATGCCKEKCILYGVKFTRDQWQALPRPTPPSDARVKGLVDAIKHWIEVSKSTIYLGDPGEASDSFAALEKTLSAFHSTTPTPGTVVSKEFLEAVEAAYKQLANLPDDSDGLGCTCPRCTATADLRDQLEAYHAARKEAGI